MTDEVPSSADLVDSTTSPASDSRGAGREQLNANRIDMDPTPADEDVVPRDALNDAEQAVLVALASGKSAADIARSLQTSEEMLGIHMANVLAKLHRTYAARSARERARTRRRRPVATR